jgi:alpha-tubulin suppressor-like RCC1 family protein
LRGRSVRAVVATAAATGAVSLLLGGCVVASPGKVYIWGQAATSTPVAQAGAPTGVTLVDAENTFYMVVAGGTLYTAPGPNIYCDNGAGRTGRIFTWTPILTDVVQMTGGNSFGVALRSDGTVWVWGNEEHDWTLGTGQSSEQCSPEQLPGLSNVVSIAAGGQHTLALTASGTVYGWGTNSDGDLALPPDVAGEDTPVPILSGYAGGRVTAGHLTSALWIPGGPGWAFGYNAFGQLGVGSAANAVYQPEKVVGSGHIAEMSFGGDIDQDGHGLLLTTGGRAYAAGDNATGQLCNGTTTNSSTFVPVTGLPATKALSAGGQHSLFLSASNGVVFACGDNSNGQLGNGTTTNARTPVAVMTGALHMDAGAESSMASA